MTLYDIPIVMYHSVNDRPWEHPLGHLAISSCEFEAQLRALRRSGFKFLTMSELLDRGRRGLLGHAKLVVLTFDDGYLDNLLYAQPILEAYDARATVYVSPAFIGEGKVRTLAEVPTAWGYLNWNELLALDASGFVDVESHTFSHDHVFVSDTVVDVYTSDKFSEYYWLIYLLVPESKTQRQDDVGRLAAAVPDGYPIFEHGRALSGRQFFPAAEFVGSCLAAFQVGGEGEVMRLASASAEKGRFETPEEWDCRCRKELSGSKEVLESRIGKRIDSVCFPGGVYSQAVLEHADRAGYDVYFRSSCEPPIQNRRALEPLPTMGHGLIGLSRISFSRAYPRRYFRRATAYWNAVLKVRDFAAPGGRSTALRMARKVRDEIRKVSDRANRHVRNGGGW